MRAARAYYNEIEPYAAEWIRNLIQAGLISPGDVDTRSIVDLQPSDLRGYDRCHFFAGIGVWDYALGLAGWPADRPVWTGSCPCQPFSAAGRRAGTADERHLWPAWFHLISECRPATVLGEQVASADGLGWLDLVHADLDGAGYAFGAADLCAAGVGAPHIRQRLWFVANADGRDASAEGLQRSWQHGQQSEDRLVGVLADAASERRDGCELAGATGAPTTRGAEAEGRWTAGLCEPARRGAAGGLGDAGCARGRRHTRAVPGPQGEGAGEGGRARRQPDQPIVAGTAGRFWASCEWIRCRDGKDRPVEPGSFPLVDGSTFRVGSGGTFEGQSRIAMLKGYGNAINAEVASAFIDAVMEVRP